MFCALWLLFHKLWWLIIRILVSLNLKCAKPKTPGVNFTIILCPVLRMHIPKAQKVLMTWLSFLCFWDLFEKKLCVKCWWNRPLFFQTFEKGSERDRKAERERVTEWQYVYLCDWVFDIFKYWITKWLKSFPIDHFHWCSTDLKPSYLYNYNV